MPQRSWRARGLHATAPPDPSPLLPLLPLLQVREVTQNQNLLRTEAMKRASSGTEAMRRAAEALHRAEQAAGQLESSLSGI